MSTQPQPEIVIPFSDKFEPTPPVGETGEKLINSQYGLFCADQPDFDEQALIEQKQRALVKLYEAGEIEDIGEVFEPWFGGVKSDSWTDAQLDFLKENLPPSAQPEVVRIADQRALVKQNQGLAAAQTKEHL